MPSDNPRAEIFHSVSNRLKTFDEMYLIRGEGLELFLLREFATPEECRTLIKMIDADKRPSTVLGPNPDGEYRSSESSPLGHRPTGVVERIEARFAELLDLDPSFGEGVEGQRYAVGQQFKPHFDYFHTDQPYWPDQERLGGQRTWTVMVCLNEPEKGGGTMFPNAGVRIRPRAGNLLAWCNVDGRGDVNESSLHCGEPVEAGTKYILTKWFRERRLTPVVVVEAAAKRDDVLGQAA